jgi:hypothetical protein
MLAELSRYSSADFALEPFPHLLVEPAVPWDEYERLEQAFPPVEAVSDGRSGNNMAYVLSAHHVPPSVAPAMRSFVKAVAGERCMREFLRLVAPHVRRAFPDFEARLGITIDEAKLALRRSPASGDISVDAQIAVNTPVTQVSRVRGVHVDNPAKLFNALLYMRPEHDATSGGDLVLYRFTGRPRFRGVSVDDAWVEPVATIPYRRNRLLLFVNTPTSLHGVSPRSVTQVPRRYINILAEARVPVFDLSAHQERAPGASAL